MQELPTCFFNQKQKFAELTRIVFFFFFSVFNVKAIIFLKSTYFKSDVRWPFVKFQDHPSQGEPSSNKIKDFTFCCRGFTRCIDRTHGPLECRGWRLKWRYFWRRKKQIPQRGLGHPIFLIYFWYIFWSRCYSFKWVYIFSNISQLSLLLFILERVFSPFSGCFFVAIQIILQ